jgi:hypothetical protein
MVCDNQWKTQFEDCLLQGLPNRPKAVLYMRQDDRLADGTGKVVALPKHIWDSVYACPCIELGGPVRPIDGRTREELQHAADVDEQLESREIAIKAEFKQYEHNMYILLCIGAAAAFMYLGSQDIDRKWKVYWFSLRIRVVQSFALGGFAISRAIDACKIWSKSPAEDTHAWTFFGRSFAIPRTYVLLLEWHRWIIVQAIDTLSDLHTLFSFVSTGTSPWIVCTWGLTCVWSLVVPLLYLRSIVDFDLAILLTLGEDFIQMVLVLYSIFESSNDHTDSVLVISAVFAICGCVEGLGNVKARLRPTCRSF